MLVAEQFSLLVVQVSLTFMSVLSIFGGAGTTSTVNDQPALARLLANPTYYLSSAWNAYVDEVQSWSALAWITVGIWVSSGWLTASIIKSHGVLAKNVAQSGFSTVLSYLVCRELQWAPDSATLMILVGLTAGSAVSYAALDDRSFEKMRLQRQATDKKRLRQSKPSSIIFTGPTTKKSLQMGMQRTTGGKKQPRVTAPSDACEGRCAFRSHTHTHTHTGFLRTRGRFAAVQERFVLCVFCTNDEYKLPLIAVIARCYVCSWQRCLTPGHNDDVCGNACQRAGGFSCHCRIVAQGAVGATLPWPGDAEQSLEQGVEKLH